VKRNTLDYAGIDYSDDEMSSFVKENPSVLLKIDSQRKIIESV
jgi:hypothetical protein